MGLERVESIEQLDELLSAPTPQAIDALAQLDGDVLVLGVAGKMGPTLARMARRASDAAGARRRVIGVARFSDRTVQARLEAWRLETIRGDLLDPAFLRTLPDAANIVYLVGMKFGSTGQEPLTWALNSFVPGLVCQRFAGSRIAALSTGNVYGLTPLGRGGSVETDALHPQGEYAMSCLGRERMFEHFSRSAGTPVTLIRLNYATELRYGVLVDVARKVAARQPVDVTMGHLNALWQGDANAMVLAALADANSPPFVVNVAGPEVLRVRAVAEEFGRLLGKPVTIVGTEAPDALLSNGALGHQRYGLPRVTIPELMKWIAAWVSAGGASLDKPTHFESRDGKF